MKGKKWYISKWFSATYAVTAGSKEVSKSVTGVECSSINISGGGSSGGAFSPILTPPPTINQPTSHTLLSRTLSDKTKGVRGFRGRVRDTGKGGDAHLYNHSSK
jgi:hypothetical protein